MAATLSRDRSRGFPPASGGWLGLTGNPRRRSDDPYEGSQAGDRRDAWREHVRHGIDEGAGRAADAAHQRSDRAPTLASEGSLLAPRPAQAGRAPPPLPDVSPKTRPGGIPGTDQGAGTQALSLRKRTPKPD